MKQLLLLFTLFPALVCFGQTNSNYELVDKKMREIPADFTNSTEHIANYIKAYFKTDEEKIRAVFYWTASNISYDVKNMFAQNGSISAQEKITKALKSRKGVCIDYAEVFKSIANQVGIQTHIIEGYTKQNGKVSNLAHAWCASKIDNKWYLFDPTWGAGGVQNGVFIKKLNPHWFKVEPSKMALSHLPFDYMWQFMAEPITNDEFISAKIQANKPKKNFDFEAEIIRYQLLPESDQLFESTARIESNGRKSPVITEYLAITKKNLTGSIQNQGVERMNAIVAEYNQAIVLFNDFIFYRNNKFKPSYPDEQIEKMVSVPKEMLQKCQEGIYSTGPVGTENSASLANTKRLIAEALKACEEQHQFLQEYLQKSKIGRKLMLAQLSWYGIPLH
ncbi:transglutaminase domain-containing protein [Flavobacterium sp. NG2]|uniref:transglutaminase domain-containing protein n=1 Tax=Flavobacterium sp. NG2 TaxID=3097547 RepID=UPI002A8362C0|nr:transglutaminase domain-containing protein [Flavobacterium sp. NG2]WPR71925.1 transglutaminase domain-containing protein [Flavobacterium sp. NG2]